MRGTLVALLVAVLATSADAVLCRKKSGVLAFRTDACKKRETLVTAEEIGAVGPAGEPGDQGPPGAVTPPLILSHPGPETTLEAEAAGATGSAGSFAVTDPANAGPALLVTHVGPGDVGVPDAALSVFIDNTNAVMAAVRGEVNSIFSNFGTAGIFGVSSGTGGFAGLFHASNAMGNGPALIALADGNGNAITANASGVGDGVEANIDGTGNAGYFWVPTFAGGRAGRFANFNDANGMETVLISNAGTGTALHVNHTGVGKHRRPAVERPQRRAHRQDRQGLLQRRHPGEWCRRGGGVRRRRPAVGLRAG